MGLCLAWGSVSLGLMWSVAASRAGLTDKGDAPSPALFPQLTDLCTVEYKRL